MNDNIVAEINAFLSAFAMLNDACNHSCEYSLTSVPNNGDVEQSLMEYFQGVKNYDAEGRCRSEGGWSVSAVAVDEWKQHLRALFSKWLFDEHFPPLTSEQEEFVKDNILDWLFRKLDPLLDRRSTVGWALEVSSRNVFYELVFDDFALESNGNIYLLHLGFSD